ncbi:MAG: type VII secretion protein EccE [Actinomycetia bacterium]|nr:type VII secretion protein EccE [Actinomycetes bacterium]
MPRGDEAVRPAKPGVDLRHALSALLVEVGVLLVVLLVLARWYVMAGVVAFLALVLLVPVRGRSALGWARKAYRYAGRKPTSRVSAEMPEDLVPLAQWVPGLTVTQTSLGRGGELGVIADGEAWTAVLALTSDDELLADRGEAIDLDQLSGLTRQDDIIFAGVQVVTYTVPAPTTVLLGGESSAATAYREIVATAMPPTLRRTWLCLRLDPRLCLEAVARRGSSNDGVFATLRFGLHRVQTVLKRQGIETRALAPVELYEVLSLVTGSGSGPTEERSRESWTTWACDGLVHCGQMVRRWGATASIGYQQLQDAIAQAPVLFAVTSYTLTPTRRATGGLRLATIDEAGAEDAITFTRQRLAGNVRLDSPAGNQIPTLLATVPLGRGAR